MSKYTIAKFCALTAGLSMLPGVSYAGKEVKDVKEVIEKCKESCITGDIGLNIVSQYVSRGVIFENQAAILEPYADLYFKMYEGEGFLNKASINLGIWNSFHSRHTDAGIASGASSSSTRSWYEFDFTAGVSFTFAKNFTFTPSYYTFLSPNDGFSTFQGLNLYYEVGIAPSVPVGPITLTFPITAGFGSDDFYGSLNTHTGNIDDESFGFFSAGVTAAYTLKFVPECYGTWTVNAGYTYYYLGQGTSDFNTEARGGAVRDGKDSEHVFSGGLSVAF
jgi:hypothetical protein